jgi:hypothetical protein
MMNWEDSEWFAVWLALARHEAYDASAFRRQAAALTADALRDLAEETTSPGE